MKKSWIILLLVIVAASAFLLGRRSGESESAPGTTPGPAIPAQAQVSDGPSTESSPEPVRTFRGPDGRAHIIGYDETNPPDSNDPAQVRAAVLSDMKYFPKNIERAYNLSPADIEAILAGSRPVPDYMLPEPPKPAVAK